MSRRLAHLPVAGRDVPVLSDIDTDRPRRATVLVSFDGGPKTTPLDPQDGSGAALAGFHLSRLVGGETTGDGAVPSWARGDSP